MRRRTLMIALCVEVLLGCTGASILADPPAAQEPDGSRVERIVLRQAEPVDVLKVLTLETPGGERVGGLHTRHSLVPAGIQATAAFPTGGILMVKGEAQAVRQFQLACTLLDVPVQKRGDDRLRVTLHPTRADLNELARKIRVLPGAGQVQGMAKSLVLEGPAAWLHQALRLAVRLELEGKGAERRAALPHHLPPLPYPHLTHHRPSGVIVLLRGSWGSPS